MKKNTGAEITKWNIAVIKSSITLLLICLSVLPVFAQQWNGHTIYSNRLSTTGYLVDTAGVTVKSWTFTGQTGYPLYMLPGGNLLRTVTNTNSLTPANGGMTGRLQIVDYTTGNILWDWIYSSTTYCLHHDVTLLPNGNILAISYDVKNAQDIADAGCTSTITAIWSEKVIEIQPVGSNSANIVWEWKLWDHLVQNVNPSKANYYPTIVDHPELMNINYQTQRDWMHMNGMDYNPVLDQIVLSSHYKNEWYIIDHSTTTAEAATHSGGLSGKGGDILYRWGNPSSYGATGPTIPNVTHDAHFIPEGCPNAGNIAGFINTAQVSPLRSSIDRVQTPRTGYTYTINPGSAFTPTSYSGRYVSTGWSSGWSCSEQFPNGNQMIVLANSGIIYEVDPWGNTLWTKSTGGTVPQAHRYSPCYIYNSPTPQPSISVVGNDLVCTSAASYQWYFNGDAIPGATNGTYTPTQTGTYLVRIRDAADCMYLYSSWITFTVTIPSAVKENNNGISQVVIFPNPCQGPLNIRVPGNGEFTAELYNVNGSLLLSRDNTQDLNLEGFDNGIYFLTITRQNEKITKKITLIK